MFVFFICGGKINGEPYSSTLDLSASNPRCHPKAGPTSVWKKKIPKPETPQTLHTQHNRNSSNDNFSNKPCNNNNGKGSISVHFPTRLLSLAVLRLGACHEVRTQEEEDHGRVAVQPRRERFDNWAGPRRHSGELRGVRVPLPHAAGDLQPRAPQPRVPRRGLLGLGLAGEAAAQLPGSAGSGPARAPRESFEEGHFRAPLTTPALRPRPQGGWCSPGQFFWLSGVSGT